MTSCRTLKSWNFINYVFKKSKDESQANPNEIMQQLNLTDFELVKLMVPFIPRSSHTHKSKMNFVTLEPINIPFLTNEDLNSLLSDLSRLKK